jgi:hypothetical protein
MNSSIHGMEGCPSPKCRPQQKQIDSPSHTLEDETRIEPGVFTDATMLSASNPVTGPSRMYVC